MHYPVHQKSIKKLSKQKILSNPYFNSSHRFLCIKYYCQLNQEVQESQSVVEECAVVILVVVVYRAIHNKKARNFKRQKLKLLKGIYKYGNEKY